MGVSREKLELVSPEAFSLPVSLSLYMGFIIRGSCEASLMVTWLPHAHTLFISATPERAKKWRGNERETNERKQKERGRDREARRERERETEGLLAAMLKVCYSYSPE